MKINHVAFSIIVIGCLLSACTKEKALLSPKDEINASNNTLLTTGLVKPLTVTTVAGNVSQGFFTTGKESMHGSTFRKVLIYSITEPFMWQMISVELYVK